MNCCDSGALHLSSLPLSCYMHACLLYLSSQCLPMLQEKKGMGLFNANNREPLSPIASSHFAAAIIGFPTHFGIMQISVYLYGYSTCCCTPKGRGLQLPKPKQWQWTHYYHFLWVLLAVVSIIQICRLKPFIFEKSFSSEEVNILQVIDGWARPCQQVEKMSPRIFTMNQGRRLIFCHVLFQKSVCL